MRGSMDHSKRSMAAAGAGSRAAAARATARKNAAAATAARAAFLHAEKLRLEAAAAALAARPAWKPSDDRTSLYIPASLPPFLIPSQRGAERGQMRDR